MARRADPAKRREWSDRIQRFNRSSQTVAEFCRAEAVSQPSFYYWQRRLACGSRRHERSRRRRRRRSGSRTKTAIGFRSVVVTPPADGVNVKVRLPGGAVIEMRDDLAVIEHVVKQLLDRQTGKGEQVC